MESNLSKEQISRIIVELLTMSHRTAISHIHDMQISETDKRIILKAYDRVYQAKLATSSTNQPCIKAKANGSYIGAISITALCTLIYIGSIISANQYYLIATVFFMCLGIILSYQVSLKVGTIVYAVSILINLIVPALLDATEVLFSIGYSILPIFALAFLIYAWVSQWNKMQQQSQKHE
nr:hypothetical protein [uncultured Christensenella sp.]